MKLSIVIPTYGRDAVLVDSIRQLLALNEPADELLVIDQTPKHDADTEEALSGWDAQGQIRWIRHDPPTVVGAMNRGLREAKGDIVLFLDDDIVAGVELVAVHRQAYVEHPETWAVVGQVIPPEAADCRPQTADLRPGRKTADPPSRMLRRTNGRQKTQDLGENAEIQRRRVDVQPSIEACVQPIDEHYPASGVRRLLSSTLRNDLDFDFNGTEPAWVENVMAGNLSVKRDQALALGGFDENFIPPVSFRFETDFAKRIVAAGGRIWFEPKALILHLRAASGGTRSKGGHMASGSPLHGVGDYYYAMKHGRGWDRFAYVVRRPFREVCTKFHLRHPWWSPVKFMGELRALRMAWKIWRKR